MLDSAFEDKASAETQRRAAEAERSANERAKLMESARVLEQVVQPGLDGLVGYLKERRTDADVQIQKVNGFTADLWLVWGRAVRPDIGRTVQASQNTFRVTLKPEGGFTVTSALLGEDFVAHAPVPSPITTEWVQAEAAKVIARSVKR
ncbi:hypothetical protein D3C87_1758830 [compost metagenome]